MVEQRTAWLSLGANLGDRETSLRAAVAGLAAAGLRIIGASHVYETAHVGPGPADAPPYLNAVLCVGTHLPPRDLLALCLRVEADGGRVRTTRNAPRTLDIDLLAMDELQLSESNLELPHPRMAERAFVLLPLSDLAPGFRLADGATAAEALQRPANRAQEVRRTTVKLVEG